MDTYQPPHSLYLTNLVVSHHLSVDNLVVNELEASEWDTSISTYIPELIELADMVESELLSLDLLVESQTNAIDALVVETNNLVSPANAAHASIVSLAAEVAALTIDITNLGNAVDAVTAAIPDVGFHSIVSIYPFSSLVGFSGSLAVTSSTQNIQCLLTGVGQYMEYDFGVQVAATYRIEWGAFQGTNAGIFDVTVSGDTQETDVDIYASANVASNMPHRFVFEHAGGSMIIRWTATDKNAASSNYYCVIGYLWLDKFGA